ncbi:MAG: hypothetical protein IJW49_05115 [Clostridia bacterium]|nr:hypothetical protein [Clostridia bacterium]
MKKNLLAKVLCFVLAMFMLLACLAACGEPAPQQNQNGNGDGNTEGGNTDGDGNTEELTGEEAEFLPAAKDYANREFRIHAGVHQAWGLVHYDYLDGLEDSNGKAVNDALYERTLLLEGLFNVILTLDTSRDDGTLLTHLNNQHKGEKDWADQLFFTGQNSMTAAKKGQLTNLLTLDALNLEASYYDQRIQQDYRIKDMLFQLTGDFDTTDELVTFGVLYNDSIYEDAMYYETEGTPYQMVESYKWTYNKMLTLAAPLVANEDNQFDVNDHVGIASESQAGYYFFLGSGLRPMSNNKGELKINLEDGTYYASVNDVLAAVSSVVTDSSFCIPSRDFASNDEYKTQEAQANKEMFIGDRALFRTSSLSTTLNGMPDMKSDFGILPIPMYQESQKAYYCSLNDVANRPLMIPYHVNNKQEVGEITEILSYYSRYGGDESLYESFFERLTIAKICRKEEDRKMLELIFSNKVYDVDRVLDLIGMHGKVTSYVGTGCTSDIDSTLNGALTSAKTTLKTYLMQFDMANQNNH